MSCLTSLGLSFTLPFFISLMTPSWSYFEKLNKITKAWLTHIEIGTWMMPKICWICVVFPYKSMTRNTMEFAWSRMYLLLLSCQMHGFQNRAGRWVKKPRKEARWFFSNFDYTVSPNKLFLSMLPKDIHSPLFLSLQMCPSSPTLGLKSPEIPLTSSCSI